MPKMTISLHSVGDAVQQAIRPWQGVVVDSRLVEGKPQYLVRYIDPETGDEDERWFDDEQVAEAPEVT